MRALAEYIISVSAAALLCGILNSMTVKVTAKEILRLVSGLFLAFCVISPVSNLRLPELSEVGADWEREAAAAAQAGEDMAHDAVSDSISEQLEAYILDKAGSMGLDIRVEITLDPLEGYLPRTLTVLGDAPVQKRKRFIQEIAEDLGIREEDVIWTQEP